MEWLLIVTMMFTDGEFKPFTVSDIESISQCTELANTLGQQPPSDMVGMKEYNEDPFEIVGLSCTVDWQALAQKEAQQSPKH